MQYITSPRGALSIGLRTESTADTAITDQTTDLLYRLTPIVKGIARKLAGNDHHAQEDYFQEASIAIYKAVLTHDPGEGSLEHYATMCARRRMMNRSRWFNLRRNEITVGNFIETGEEKAGAALEVDHELRGVKNSGTSIYDAVDGSFIWDLALAELTNQEMKALRLVYAEGLLASETAVKLKVSAPRVTQLINAALSKLRNILALRDKLN